MAEMNDDIEIAEEETGGSKKMLIIIVVAVLALAGGGAFFFLGGSEEAAPANEEVAEAPNKKQAPIYFSLDKPLVINFAKQSNNEVRYVQLKLKVMARDQDVIDSFQLHLPAIQHELLLLLYSQKYDELNQSTSNLQKAVLETVNTLLKKEGIQNELKAVYFTSFLMQ